MILILFLCIKLSILHVCVSDLRYECSIDNPRRDPTIFLIGSRYDKPHHHTNTLSEYFRRELNSKFKSLCGEYYNIKIGSPGEAKYYTNVIQFSVPGYDGKPPENFEYAGNISKIDDAECTRTNKSGFDCHDIVNLVTHSVKNINNGHIYDIVQEMQLIWNNDGLTITHRESCEPHFQKISNLMIVLLCYRRDEMLGSKQVNIRPLTLIQLRDDYCPNYLNETLNSPHLNRLLAVLAPKPFELPSEYSVPTIFYEAPYLFSEDKVEFPNSMNLVPWRLLKYGFLKFIQKVGWHRVAVVTDDSEYSLDFEDELTTLFSKERLMYTVIRCEDTKCDMNKITQELRRGQYPVRIAIANVDEKHAKHLLRHAGATIWLLRDMAGRITREEFTPNAFSFSLHSTYDKGCPDVEDNILTGLSSIAQAYETFTNNDYNVKKRKFYSLFADRVKQVTPRITEAKIVVRNLNNGLVARMDVNENGANMLHYDDLYEAGKPNDGAAQCLVLTDNFHEPCDDPLLIFLMFIIMMFALTILLIMCFFDKTSPFNDIRYQNF